MREIVEAVVLGVIQGLTEFIPVSSSGHLVLAPRLLGLRQPELAFDVALHVGTFAAVLLFFRADIRLMLRALLGLDRGPVAGVYRRLAALIALGSIPIAVVGVVFTDVFEAAFGSPTIAALFLVLTGVMLLAGEASRSRRGGARAGVAAPPERVMLGEDAADPEGVALDRIGAGHALIVGVGQSLALFPGISRSGSTIATGMAAGLTRPAATRFSFLLALPALVGASLVSLPDLADGGGAFGLPAILAGVVSAFLAGYLAIRWLIALVARDRLNMFAYYCFAVGLASLVVLWLSS